MRFLHCGAEAARKGGFEVMRSFRKAFQNRDDDVELTLKMINPGWNIPTIGRAVVVNRTLGLEQLVDLFQEHHAYVYPSWGEGFGLTPLQALATGMPTVTVPDWAPYAHHLDDNLKIKAKPHHTQWPVMHPGTMFSPSIDDMIDRMRWLADNYDEAADFAYAQTGPVHEEYDWLSLTKDAFDALQGRLNL
jgi:glycosyltransferase involved in cell wall biosynthesis